MKFVIHFSGPSCSGKSTVEEELGRRLPGAYTVSYDKLKWQLAGYHRDKDRELIKDLLLGFFEVVCERELPIFLQCFMRDEDEHRKYAAVAKANGYVMHSVEFTTPTEILIERFRERVERVKATGGRASITDEDLYRKNLEWRQYVPDGTPSFDTSALTTEQIVESIISQFSLHP